MAQRRVDGLALLERKLQAAQPLTTLDPEQIRARRLALQAAVQHRVDLLLGARAAVDELLTAGEPAAQHPAALIRPPHRLKLPLPQQPRQRTRVKPIGLRARLHDPGVIRANHNHTLHVRLENPRDLPRAASHLQRHPIRRLKALRQRLERLRSARHPPSRPDHPVLADRDHAEVTMNIQTDRTTNPPQQRHLSPPVRRQRAGEPAGQRHRPIRARSSIQASRRGGRTNCTGSKPIAKNGLPVCVLPRRPLSRITRRYGRNRTDPPRSSFMPRMGGARRRVDRDSLSLAHGYHECGAVAGCVRQRSR